MDSVCSSCSNVTRYDVDNLYFVLYVPAAVLCVC
jgi:hypothetical protein